MENIPGRGKYKFIYALAQDLFNLPIPQPFFGYVTLQTALISKSLPTTIGRIM